jgi:prephenate dehydrogenase
MGVTTVVVLFVRLGSPVAEETVEVAVVLPTAMVGATLTTTTMLADVPAARLAIVQFTVPVAPTTGVVQAHPTGIETDWNVVFVGVASLKLTVVAAMGPLFVTVCV